MEEVQGVESLSAQGERTARVKSGVLLTHLPMPPSENQLYPSMKSGRRISSKALIDYQRQMRDWRMINLTKAAEAKRRVDVWLMGGNVLTIEIVLGFHSSDLYTKKGDVKKMDAANRVKAFNDCLGEFILDQDDKMFFEVRVEKVQIDDSLPLQVWCLITPMTPKILRKCE